MAMESLSKRNGTSMLDCETYKSIRYNPFVPLPHGRVNIGVARRGIGN